jgi:20S proteasome alpha/beta subunit
LTLIVALRGKITDASDEEGVVIASDTQASSYTKSPMRKVFQLGDLPMLVGGSGSLSLSRHVIYRLDRMARQFHKIKRKASCEDFDEFVNSDVESFLREIVRLHPDVIKRSGLSLILSFSDSIHVRLYQVQRDGIPMRMDHDPGYCCIGSGFATGGNLLIKQFYKPDSSLIQLMKLASYMIFQISDVDPFVGGSIQMKLNFGGNAVNPIDNLELKGVKRRSETIRKVWDLLASQPVDFEERFNEALTNGSLKKVVRGQRMQQ